MARGATTTSDVAVFTATCGRSPRPLASVTAAGGGVLGLPVVVNASATADADTPFRLLSFSWALVGSPAVRRPAPAPASGGGVTVFHAASLQPLAPTQLTTASLVPSRTAASAAALSPGGAPPYPFAAFSPDGVGSYVVSATASDGCTSEAAVLTATVSCAAPGPLADAGGEVLLLRNLTVPLSTTAGGSAGLVSLELGRAPLMGLFGRVFLAATPGTGAAAAVAYAWVLLSAPPDSGYATSPTGLPAVAVSPTTGALSAALPASVLSLAPNVSFAPDALGTFVLLLAASDGCSVAFDTVAVTALIDAVLPVGAAGLCASPSAAPAPVPCTSVGSTATTAEVAFTLELGGVSPAAVAGSAALQAALVTSIAATCGVDASAVKLLVATSGGSRALELLVGDALRAVGGGSIARRLATTAVACVVTLPPALATNTSLARIILALSAYVQNGGLVASLAASPALLVRHFAETLFASAPPYVLLPPPGPCLQSSEVTPTSASLLSTPSVSTKTTVNSQAPAASPALDLASPWFIVPVVVACVLVLALVATCCVVFCCCEWRGRRSAKQRTPPPAPRPPLRPVRSAAQAVPPPPPPARAEGEAFDDDDDDGSTGSAADPEDLRVDMPPVQQQQSQSRGGAGGGRSALAQQPGAAPMYRSRVTTPVEPVAAPAAVRRPIARPTIRLGAPVPGASPATAHIGAHGGGGGLTAAPVAVSPPADPGVGFTGRARDAEVPDYRNPMLSGEGGRGGGGGGGGGSSTRALPRAAPGLRPRPSIQLVPRS